MVASVAVRQVERKSRKKPPKVKINKEFAKKKPLPGATMEETVTQYRAFAVKTARKYLANRPGTKLDFDDAYAIVCMALCKAHEKYNPDKGANFLTYSSQWARAYLDQKGDFQYRLIHIPPNRLKKYVTERFALSAYDDEISPLYLTKPSKKIYDEIRKDKTKLSEVRERVKLFDGFTYLTHLESPIKTNTCREFTPTDKLIDEEQLTSLEIVHAESVRRRLKICIEKLDERQRYIIRNRVMNDKPPTLEKIGQKWGVSRERARQLEVKALNKLRFLIANDRVLSNYKPHELCNIRIPTEEKHAKVPAKYEQKRKKKAA